MLLLRPSSEGGRTSSRKRGGHVISGLIRVLAREAGSSYFLSSVIVTVL
jgi:hypothetical protein